MYSKIAVQILVSENEPRGAFRTATSAEQKRKWIVDNLVFIWEYSYLKNYTVNHVWSPWLLLNPWSFRKAKRMFILQSLPCGGHALSVTRSKKPAQYRMLGSVGWRAISWVSKCTNNRQSFHLTKSIVIAWMSWACVCWCHTPHTGVERRERIWGLPSKLYSGDIAN